MKKIELNKKTIFITGSSGFIGSNLCKRLLNKLVNNEKIKIFNYGNCKRDFTYIDDIVEGIIRVMKGAPDKKLGEDGLPIPPYAVYNIGNSNPENLLEFVKILQEELVRVGVLPENYDFESHEELVPMQAGDVPITYADTIPLQRDYGFKPNTSLGWIKKICRVV